MKIQDLQTSLLKYFGSNSKTAKLMSYAKVFVFIYLGLTILDIFSISYPLSTVVNVVTAISYYLFLIGAVMIFAQNKYMPVTIVYGVKFIDRLLYMIMNSFYITSFVYMIIYCVIAYGLFKLYLYTSSNNTQVSITQPQNCFCKNCGNVVIDNDLFCKNCGEEINKKNMY